MVTLKGNKVSISGKFLERGQSTAEFVLCDQKLSDVSLKSFENKSKVLVTIPSIDTGVCAQESIAINALAKKHPQLVFLVVSRDTPFALTRFCKDKNLTNIVPLSDIRESSTFGKDYGVLISNGPLSGFLARSIIVLDAANVVQYCELVPEISSMPNFEKLEKELEK